LGQLNERCGKLTAYSHDLTAFITHIHSVTWLDPHTSVDGTRRWCGLGNDMECWLPTKTTVLIVFIIICCKCCILCTSQSHRHCMSCRWMWYWRSRAQKSSITALKLNSLDKLVSVL